MHFIVLWQRLSLEDLQDFNILEFSTRRVKFRCPLAVLKRDLNSENPRLSADTDVAKRKLGLFFREERPSQRLRSWSIIVAYHLNFIVSFNKNIVGHNLLPLNASLQGELWPIACGSHTVNTMNTTRRVRIQITLEYQTEDQMEDHAKDHTKDHTSSARQPRRLLGKPSRRLNGASRCQFASYKLHNAIIISKQY